MTFAIAAMDIGVHWLAGESLPLGDGLHEVVTNPIYQVSVIAIGVLHLRLILFRMADKARTL